MNRNRNTNWCYGSVGLVVTCLAALPAVADAPSAPVMPPNAILVSGVADPAGGSAWDITLPPGTVETLTDQIWLVVDGTVSGMSGGDYWPADADKPLRIYANISDKADREVKDVLRAQGMPVKDNVVVYHITGGVNRPSAYSYPETLQFRHATNITAYTPLRNASYKVGDKITLFDAVMLDNSVKMSEVRTSNDLYNPKYKRLPNDLIHRVTIQIQFLPIPKTPTP